MKKVITTFAALALIVSVTSCREPTDKTKEAVETADEKAVEATETVKVDTDSMVEAVEVATDTVVEAVQLQKLQLIGVDLGNEGLLRVVAFLEDHSSASLHRLALGWDAIDDPWQMH